MRCGIMHDQRLCFRFVSFFRRRVHRKTRSNIQEVKRTTLTTPHSLTHSADVLQEETPVRSTLFCFGHIQAGLLLSVNYTSLLCRMASPKGYVRRNEEWMSVNPSLSFVRARAWRSAIRFHSDFGVTRQKERVPVDILFSSGCQICLKNNMRKLRATCLPAANILMVRIVIVVVGTKAYLHHYHQSPLSGPTDSHPTHRMVTGASSAPIDSAFMLCRI